MRLNRKKLVGDLENFATLGNGVIIGPPGVGKTYLVTKLIETFESRNKLCLFLPIDQLGSGRLEDLQNELEFKGQLTEWVDNIFSQKRDLEKGIIIFDSFDSARDEIKRNNFLTLIRDIIEKLSDKINVIVVVRTFDAKKSNDLLNLFPFVKVDHLDSYHDKDIICNHFLIPLLNSEDITQAKEQISGLSKIYSNASYELRELLHIPFNLWLLEKILIASGGNEIDFGYIQSEVQLLGLFWKKRVTESRMRIDKEIILVKLTKNMVNQKILSIRFDQIYVQTQAKIWDEIFSDEILKRVSINENRVSFSHNILFDYAVNILLIEDNERELEKFLLEDFSRPLFLRPSLVYFFTRLWYEENKVFWKIFWYLLSSHAANINLFARLIPTSVIINEIKSADEICSIFEKLKEDSELANDATKRILQTYRVRKNKKWHIWSSVLLQISNFINERFLWELCSNNLEIIDQALSNQADNISIQNCGEISRRILEWVLQHRSINKNWLDNIGARFGVPMVVKTLSSSTKRSIELFNQVLKLIEEEDFNIDYYFMLANVIDKIWDVDQEFVQLFYEKIFETEVNEDTPTNMGGPVLPLVSNRRQDYHICHYELEQKFKGFLNISPIRAGTVAIRIANIFAIKEHVIPYINPGYTLDSLTKIIIWNGKECTFIRDMSYIWSSSKYEEEYNEELKILNTFFENIPKIVENGERIENIVNIIINHSQVAYIWSRLLKLGSENPDLLFLNMFELLTNTEILFSSETKFYTGEFIKSSQKLFSIDQTKKLEAIIGEYVNEDTDEKYMLEKKASLLNCLPFDKITTKSKELINKAKKLERPIDNIPPVSLSTYSGTYTDEEYWQDFGVDIKKKENQELKKINEKLSNFIQKWQNIDVEKQAINNFIPYLREIYNSLLVKRDNDSVLINSVWSKITEATKILLSSLQQLSDDQYKALKEIILHCSAENSPKPDPEFEMDYKFPSWSPAPRNEAAIILPWLYANKKEEELLDAIKRLSFDPVASVRFLIIRNLWRISENANTIYWNIIDDLIAQENNVVVNGSILESLSHTLTKDRMNSQERLLKIIPAGLKAKNDSRFFESSSSQLIRMIILYKIEDAKALFEVYIKNPINNSKILKSLTFQALTVIEPSYLNNNNEEIFDNAVVLLRNLISSANIGLDELLKLKENNQEEYKETLHNVYGIIHEIITRIYFHADIPDREFKKNKSMIEDSLRSQFYKKTLVLLDDILNIIASEKKTILFAPTAHYFMQYLNGVLKYDPKKVLHMAYLVAHSSRDYNYNLDTMAIREVTKLVDNIIANYREQFLEENNLKDLVGLLDIFADTGWPEALELVWHLDEIYR